jgi:hypothetical protein
MKGKIRIPTRCNIANLLLDLSDKFLDMPWRTSIEVEIVSVVGKSAIFIIRNCD